MKGVDQNSENYFHVDLELLKPKAYAIYPFQIFVYHPIAKNYNVFLHGNSPLTKEKLEFLKFITQKGGEVAISRKQKRTFLHSCRVKEEDIPSLKEVTEHEFITRQRERAKKREQKESKEKFHFKDELEKATKSDNWMPLIEEIRDLALTFPYTISHTVSLASTLAEKLLTKDSPTNRVVALSAHLAQGCGMKDPLALGDLICAAFLAHLGHTQMQMLFSQKAYLELSSPQRRDYSKHPGLSQHMIRKSGLIISERCNKILYQHHERFDGSGYPEYKQGQFIEPLALVLGASAHILEYSSGKITGSPVAMSVVIKNMKEKTLSPGLEIEFGDTIYESLIYLLDSPKKESENTAEAA